MEFKIVTPDGVTYQDDVTKVTLPTEAGEITVLERHAPMVSVIAAGEVTIFKADGETHLSVSRGVLEIRPSGEVYMITDTAERAEDIDIDRAEEARKRAEELLKQQQNMADVDFARLQAKIEKELARISVGRKWKKLK